MGNDHNKPTAVMVPKDWVPMIHGEFSPNLRGGVLAILKNQLCELREGLNVVILA